MTHDLLSVEDPCPYTDLMLCVTYSYAHHAHEGGLVRESSRTCVCLEPSALTGGGKGGMERGPKVEWAQVLSRDSHSVRGLGMEIRKDLVPHAWRLTLAYGALPSQSNSVHKSSGLWSKSLR